MIDLFPTTLCNRVLLPLRCGQCLDTVAPQYLLEELPSGDLVPILSFEREGSSFTSQGSDFPNFAGRSGLQSIPVVERFYLLGLWIARAYVLSDLGYSPGNFHQVIYDSLIAGHAIAPAPMPNAYEDRVNILQFQNVSIMFNSEMGFMRIKTACFSTLFGEHLFKHL